jgi:hypothetical protein
LHIDVSPQAASCIRSSIFPRLRPTNGMFAISSLIAAQLPTFRGWSPSRHLLRVNRIGVCRPKSIRQHIAKLVAEHRRRSPPQSPLPAQGHVDDTPYKKNGHPRHQKARQK